ncbi:transmembrane protein 71 isoform X1 [Hypanus sabinus]|uniref:transmembrane protein 71 isoform X1 n=1 Tax=Hypanus sabinus TaxID=79690 RepID=UPI0028C3DB14|nr:transmembrane protein 71 isoform X1 [Hypanus sabinus]
MYPGSEYLSNSLHAAQIFPEEVPKELSPKRVLQSISLMTSESPYSPCHLNLLGGSPCVCRRSPRLLTNGYYDVSEESFIDEEGNITLTPSKINISYKENLVRVFRRRRKARRSFASFFNMDSSGSWLNSQLFSGANCPLAESSWIDEGSDCDTSYSHKQGQSSVDLSMTDKSWLLEETQPFINAKVFSTEDLLIDRSQRFLDLPSHSQIQPAKCYVNNAPNSPEADVRLSLKRVNPRKAEGPDGVPDLITIRNYFSHLIILALSISIAVFARCFFGGMIAALISTTLLFATVLTTARLAYTYFIKSQKILQQTQAEVIKYKCNSTLLQVKQ